MTRRTRFAPRAFAALASIASLALFASGCGSSTTAASTTTNGLTTDTLNGSVAVNGSDFKTFSVGVAGEVDITLTTVNPAVTMGLAMGLPGGSGCVPIVGASTQAAAGASAQIAGEVTPGSFCVLVSDIGNLTSPATYTVTVTHP